MTQLGMVSGVDVFLKFVNMKRKILLKLAWVMSTKISCILNNGIENKCIDIKAKSFISRVFIMTDQVLCKMTNRYFEDDRPP